MRADAPTCCNLPFVAAWLTLALWCTAGAPGQESPSHNLKDVALEMGLAGDEAQAVVQSFAAGKLREARGTLIRLASQDSQLPPADTMLARLLLATNQTAAALDALERSVAAAPQDPFAYVLLGQLALREGRVAFADLSLGKAQTLLAEAAENAPLRTQLEAAVHAGLAAVAERRENWARAEQHLAAWGRLEPQNAEPLSRRAQAQFHLQHYDQAVAGLQAARRLNEDLPNAEIGMALLYEQVGAVAEATKWMDRASRDARPQDRLAIAQWAIRNGLEHTARRHAEAVLQEDGRLLEAQLLIALLARVEQDHDRAESLLEEAHLRAPGNFAVTNHLALTLIEREEADKRRRAWEFARLNAQAHDDLRQPAARQAAVTLAWVLFRLGRQSEALQKLQQAIDAGSLQGESLYLAARMIHDRGQRELAAKILQPLLRTPVVFPHRTEAEQLLASLQQEDEPRE